VQCRPVRGTAEAFWETYPGHRTASRHSLAVGANHFLVLALRPLSLYNILIYMR
jgi:hypothetical protein